MSTAHSFSSAYWGFGAFVAPVKCRVREPSDVRDCNRAREGERESENEHGNVTERVGGARRRS